MRRLLAVVTALSFLPGLAPAQPRVVVEAGRSGAPTVGDVGGAANPSFTPVSLSAGGLGDTLVPTQSDPTGAVPIRGVEATQAAVVAPGARVEAVRIPEGAARTDAPEGGRAAAEPIERTPAVTAVEADFSASPAESGRFSAGAGVREVQLSVRDLQAEQAAAAKAGVQASPGALQNVLDALFNRQRRAPSSEGLTPGKAGPESEAVRADAQPESSAGPVFAANADRLPPLDARAPGWHRAAIESASGAPREGRKAAAAQDARNAVLAAVPGLGAAVRAAADEGARRQALSTLSTLSGWDALLADRELYPERGGRPYIEGLRSTGRGEGFLPRAQRVLGSLDRGEAASFPDLTATPAGDGWMISQARPSRPSLREVAAIAAGWAGSLALPMDDAFASWAAQASGEEPDAEGSPSRGFDFGFDVFFLATGLLEQLSQGVQTSLRDTGPLLALQDRGWLRGGLMVVLDRRPARVSPLRESRPVEAATFSLAP